MRSGMSNANPPTKRDNTAEACTLSLGLLSVACGGALLVAPRLFGALFSLPSNRPLLRLLGARDVLIGRAILAPASRHTGLLLRSASDTIDGVMIATQLARRKAGAIHGTAALSIAALSAATALWLAQADAQ